jgi:hypothetical protein
VSLFGQFSALVCKNCSRPIPLPAAVYPSPDQPSWPADCAPRSFLCPTCRHVFVYLVSDVREVDFDQAAPPSIKLQNVVRLAVPCGAGGCVGLVQMRTLMAFDANLYGEVPEILGQSTAHNIPCDKGHILSGPIRHTGTSFSAEFDKAWKLGYVQA